MMASPAGLPRLADVLAEYEVRGELGRGAMGVVLSARHRSLDRLVAIKQLPPSFAADPEVRSRFLREARTLAALDHPHVVAVYDFIDRHGHLALVMEQLPGGTVWDHFLADGVAPGTACALILGTAAGLAHAHERGVLHRDVKPDNLMFTASGLLKVTDFGIAKVMGGERTLATADGLILGTPAYMAPEQAEGRVVGPASDVYACGTMLFELLSGVLPFPDIGTPLSALVARLRADAPPLLASAPTVPPAIAAVVDRSLAQQVADRYQTVVDFAVELGRAAADSWGPEWLAATRVRVTGSEPIEAAARTAGGLVGPQVLGKTVTAGPVADDHRSVASGFQAPAANRPISAADRTSGGHPAMPHGSVVLPEAGHRMADDYSRISPSDVVDISEVNRPIGPGLPLVLALALVALGGAVAAIGLASVPAPILEPPPAEVWVNGQLVDGSHPPAVDLSAPIVVDGLPAGDLELVASLLGVPIGLIDLPPPAPGSVDASDPNGGVGGEQPRIVEPGYLQWTTAGVVDLTVRGDGGATIAAFPAVTTHRWYSTAPAAGALVIGLFGLATVQANLHGLRPGRIRPGPLIGLAIGGAAAGAAVAIAAAAAFDRYLAAATLVVTAALVAASALALGEGYRRWRRR
jgi:serine/threonine-protein kinase